MKSRLYFRNLIFLFPGIVIWAGILNLPAGERWVLERAAQSAVKPFFADSIRIQKVRIDWQGKIHIQNLSGKFQARQGPVPLEIRSIVSRDSLLRLLAGQPVHFSFDGVRPRKSMRPGLRGDFSIRTGRLWYWELEADFSGLDLEDLQWLDPQNLQSATGAMKGKLRFSQTSGREPVLDIQVEAPQPGGLIQARFFDLFLPYLPQSLQKERVNQLVAEKNKVVRYQDATLDVHMSQSDRMKILLRILVLDYNLKLTLNADIRTDAKDAFSQIAQLLGLIEVRGT